ncbi:MAG: hypothetical protein ACJAZ2_000732 [Glaciecola sp.]|jgi:hypothetical protein
MKMTFEFKFSVAASVTHVIIKSTTLRQIKKIAIKSVDNLVA